MSGGLYRIGFLNPWEEGAEVQAFESLAIAARRIGHELIRVRNSADIIAANLDFALAIEPGQPKTTDVPTFCVVHSPRSILLEKQSHLENISYLQSLLSYDGYLTISDNLYRFIDTLCSSVGRPSHIGFYYNAPQQQTLTCSIEKIVARDALRLCYFGINWEPRARPLFRTLAQRPYMRFYGPRKGWEYLRNVRYYDEVPFDGRSVQRTYATFGAGLVVLSLQHTLDDVISNRIFEIASVGAVVVCPDLPWVRQNFGDTVFYYDRFAPAPEAVRQIDRIMAEIQARPKEAGERAQAARRIFAKRFAGEVMLQNAVRYFEEWRCGAGRQIAPADGPLIDVVVRAGRQLTENLLQTLRSIDAQSAGRFRVIFACPAGSGLAAPSDISWQRIESFATVRAGGGGRSALTAALKAVDAGLFAILEEGNFWLSGHIASLLALIARAPQQRAYAYSGTLRVEAADESPGADGDAGRRRENRRVGSLEPLAGEFERVVASLTPDSFLAASALLRSIDLDNCAAGDAETAVFQAKLISRAEPVFSGRPTACLMSGRNDAAAAGAEEAFAHLLSLQGDIDRIERKFAAPAIPAWSRLHRAMQQIIEEQRQALIGNSGVLALEGGSVIAPMHMRDDIEREQLPFTPEAIGCGGDSRLVDGGRDSAVLVLPIPSPWAFGIRIQVDRSMLFAGAQWIVLEFPPVTEMFGVGLLDRSDEFLTRMHVPVSSIPVEAWLHVPDPEQLVAIVVQNWISPLTSGVTLNRAWAVREQASDYAESGPRCSTKRTIPIGRESEDQAPPLPRLGADIAEPSQAETTVSAEQSVPSTTAPALQQAPGTVLFGGARIGAPLPAPIVGPWPNAPVAHEVRLAGSGTDAVQFVPGENAAALSRPLAIGVEILVHSGIVGVGTQSSDRSTVVDEWWAKPTPEPVLVILPVVDPRAFGGLVLRDIVAAASRATVFSLSAYALAIDEGDVFVGAQDNLSMRNEERIAREFDAGGFAMLRAKWSEIPNHGVSRVSSAELNKLSDPALRSFYDEAMNRMSNWYYAVYGDAFRGKRVLDVGSGCGFDAIWFAGRGADWTCADVVHSNIENIKRLATLRSLDIKAHYLEDFSSFDDLGTFDVIWCNGSMINAPFNFAALESQKLLEHLAVGGRWIELGYPKQRWEREGHLPLHRWGERTDGIGTPWMEWYDTAKLQRRLAPAEVDVLMAFDHADGTLNWFDLRRCG